MLQYSGTDLRSNRLVVEAAVTNCGVALVYANRTLKANKEIVLAAIKNNPEALRYATNEDLFKDQDVEKSVSKTWR